MARNSQESSSKRHFHWTTKIGAEDGGDALFFKSSSVKKLDGKDAERDHSGQMPTPRKKLQALASRRFRSLLSNFGKSRTNLPSGLGPRVVGTLFGARHGHVHFAIQKDPTSSPAFLVELATPITGLVKEMASGLVRIALECDKEKEGRVLEKRPARLLEEPKWRTYCNGKKCGYAIKRDCGAKEWKVLKAVEPISMGAGVLPAGDNNPDGELMYMRAKFERIVGSRDSEAFYMMNPDCNGAPELSIYMLRV